MVNWRDGFVLQLVAFQWLEYFFTVFPSVEKTVFFACHFISGCWWTKDCISARLVLSHGLPQLLTW